MKLKTLLFAGLTTVTLASCSTNKTISPKDDAKYSSNEKVKCLKHARTGTHIFKKRCYKRSELERIRKETQQNMSREMNRHSGTSNDDNSM